MKKKSNPRRIFIIILTSLISIIVLLLLFQQIAESKIKKLLSEELPESITVNYKDLDYNVFTSTIHLDHLFMMQGDADAAFDTELTMISLKINGISGWNYLIHKKITVQSILLETPVLVHRPTAKKNTASKKEKSDTFIPIHIENISVSNGAITVYEKVLKEEQFAIKKIDLNVSEIVVNKKTLKNKIPFTFQKYKSHIETVFVKLSRYEQLEIASIKIQDTTIVSTGNTLKTIYSKQQLSKKINKERDHIVLTIPKIKLDHPTYEYQKDTFLFKTNAIAILKPRAEFYRDKLVADDTRLKNLYGTMLRELSFDLDLGLVSIEDGYVSYTERIDADIVPEKIYFDHLQAKISNVSNLGGEVKIDVQSYVMGSPGLDVDWSFDPAAIDDAFVVSGSLTNFNASALNPFLKSNARSEATGTIDELYFTTSGSRNKATGDMKMKYNNFEFVVLKKNRLGINKVFTKIGNLFINNGSKADTNGYRYGIIETKRDVTKSFFNYLWLQVRDGMLSTLAGNGKKN